MSASPLTVLSDDEKMFYDAIYDFARNEIGHGVSEMDEAGKIDPDLIPALFELGLMGIEIPERFGGSGSDIFTAILAIEDARASRPKRFRLRRRAEYSRQQRNSSVGE